MGSFRGSRHLRFVTVQAIQLKKLIALLFFATSAAFAGGPNFQQKDALVQQEFDNVYFDLGNAVVNGGTARSLTITTATITNLSVSSAVIVNATISVSTITTLTVGTLTGVSVGKLLKISSGTLTSTFSTSATSFQATGLKAVLSPTVGTSRVLCIASFALKTSNGNGDIAYVALFKNGSNITGTSSQGMNELNAQVTAIVETPAILLWVDAPASTSAQTYEVYLNTSAGGATASINSNTSKSTGVIFCAEIGV